MGYTPKDTEVQVTLATVGDPPITGHIDMPPVLVGAVVGDSHPFTFKGINTSAIDALLQVVAMVYDPTGVQIASNNETQLLPPNGEVATSITVNFEKAGIYKATVYLWHLW